MSLTVKIMSVLHGSAYLGDDGLRDYHRAQAVKAALRRREPSARLAGVREALSQYRVTAWLREDGRIHLMCDGQDVLTL